MAKGLRPALVDYRDKRFSFERHFGAVSTFPDSYSVELGLRVQDQDADNRPSACTGYAVTDVCADQDGFLASADYNYMKTLELMGALPETQGADLRKAAKVPVAFGLVPRDDEPGHMFQCSQAWSANQANWPLSFDDEAATFKKPAYIPVQPGFGQDWFDAIRSALINGKAEKRAVAVGTRWSPSFETLPASAKLPDAPTNLYWGHAYVLCGWKTIGGFPYLVVKSWQGTGYGDKGFAYMSRALCNKLMGELGTYAFTYAKLPQGTTVDQLKAQIVSLQEVIALLTALIQNLYISAKYGLSQRFH